MPRTTGASKRWSRSSAICSSRPAATSNEALEWLKQIAEEYGLFDEGMTMDDIIEKLREMGLIEDAGTGVQLTQRGVQRIRQDALREIFTSLKKATPGVHETPFTGIGVERTERDEDIPFGDQPTNIDLTSTLTNAFRRGGIEDFTLKEEDLEVYETEHQTGCATVLMIDISHSMVLYGEDRITPAKQVALALSELIHDPVSRRTTWRWSPSATTPSW